MELIHIPTGAVIGSIITNHSMTLEEAIDCLGGKIINHEDDDRFSCDGDNVIIDGRRYWYDDIGFAY